MQDVRILRYIQSDKKRHVFQSFWSIRMRWTRQLKLIERKECKLDLSYQKVSSRCDDSPNRESRMRHARFQAAAIFSQLRFALFSGNTICNEKLNEKIINCCVIFFLQAKCRSIRFSVDIFSFFNCCCGFENEQKGCQARFEVCTVQLTSYSMTT